MNPISTDAAGRPGGKPVTGEQRHRPPPASYQIRVRGHLGAATRRAFSGLDAETRGQDTVLQGVADQAALHGVLARIESLGLELLEVSRRPGPQAGA